MAKQREDGRRGEWENGRSGEIASHQTSPFLPFSPSPFPKSSPGKVFLVGAGPGDPGLITWRGVECLQQADLVLFDYLANPAILRHAAPEAELVCVGKHGRDRIWSQAEINERLVAAAREGRRIVRL